MGVSTLVLATILLFDIKQITIVLQVDKAADKVLLSRNHQVNLTARC